MEIDVKREFLDCFEDAKITETNHYFQVDEGYLDKNKGYFLDYERIYNMPDLGVCGFFYLSDTHFYLFEQVKIPKKIVEMMIEQGKIIKLSGESLTHNPNVFGIINCEFFDDTIQPIIMANKLGENFINKSENGYEFNYSARVREAMKGKRK